MDGVLVVVADRGTMVPGESELFSEFGPPVIDGNTVAFHGVSQSGKHGVYRWASGTISVIADEATAIPGGIGTFTGFAESFTLDSGFLAFRGVGSSGQQGIYSFSSGSLRVVVDGSTPQPGGSGTFTDLSINSGGSDGSNLVFAAASGAAVFTEIEGVLDVVADSNTPIPGGSFFSNPQIEGEDIVFFGAGWGAALGIFLLRNGSLDRLTDRDILSSVGPTPMLSDGMVAWTAGNDQLLLLWRAGITETILPRLAELDGKTVNHVHAAGQGFDQGEIIFTADFVDGSSAVFVATVLPATNVPASADALRVVLIVLLVGIGSAALVKGGGVATRQRS
jgi:hypothetical protein